jgi:hypothetical protein
MVSILDPMDPVAEPSASDLTDLVISLSSRGPTRRSKPSLVPEPEITKGKQKLPKFNDATA